MPLNNFFSHDTTILQVTKSFSKKIQWKANDLKTLLIYWRCYSLRLQSVCVCVFHYWWSFNKPWSGGGSAKILAMLLPFCCIFSCRLSQLLWLLCAALRVSTFTPKSATLEKACLWSRQTCSSASVRLRLLYFLHDTQTSQFLVSSLRCDLLAREGTLSHCLWKEPLAQSNT